MDALPAPRLSREALVVAVGATTRATALAFVTEPRMGGGCWDICGLEAIEVLVLATSISGLGRVVGLCEVTTF